MTNNSLTGGGNNNMNSSSGCANGGKSEFIKRLSEAMHNESDDDTGMHASGAGKELSGKDLLKVKEKYAKKNFSNAAYQSFMKEFTGR